jgi:hypothetical protein
LLDIGLNGRRLYVIDEGAEEHGVTGALDPGDTALTAVCTDMVRSGTTETGVSCDGVCDSNGNSCGAVRVGVLDINIRKYINNVTD